jgi:hypothetical protein
VQAYDPETGYIRVEEGRMGPRNIYLPVPETIVAT